MAGLFDDDVERNAVASEPPPIKAVAYGSIQPIDSSSRNTSLVELSPLELPRPGYTHPHQHRIIPPSIKGHGRLIIAHRTVPYWVGVIFVVGAFSWAVWCALYIYPLLGGHPNDWRIGIGDGW
ncbi:hypothetical protein FB567DRAFT_542018 [Paraphoma chrysanthemicola]|uniref:Uncharacterized protein n=1 Tax=Paraphoma chrysanthemicola TaxID=798071 RepID=A0A8K0VRX1_9PLEO|nr:hypothetical protein FB567DRAFT_542018 [Paraphoma chrysanthemicola]